MEEIRDLAVVLRSVQFEEKHRIVTGLTEKHGKVSVIARNAVQSRRFGGALEHFAAGEWSFSIRPGAEIGSLREATIKRDFSGISKDFEKLALASFFNEVSLRLAPAGVPCVDLFKIHSNALVALEEAASSEKLLALANLYLVKVLSWCGNQPQLLRCLKCDKGIQTLTPSDWIEGDIQAAGWVCSECASHATGRPNENTKRIPSDALKDLLFGASESLRKAIVQAHGIREEHAPLFSFLTRVLAYHVPGFDQLSMKSLRFLTGDNHL